MVASRLAAEDPLGGVAAAERALRRFESDPAAWVLLGVARESAFQIRNALVAYELALMLEERADAAMAAGRLYSQLGDHATAGARFARAYAAGAGLDALEANAAALRAAGDQDAAQQAVELWERETGRSWSD